MKLAVRLALVTSFLLTSSAAAHPGIGVVVDNRGNIFYTDLKQVWKIDPQGRKSIAVPNVHTHELFLDRADNLYGEHLWYEGDRTGKWGHRVWRLSATGELAGVIPPTEGFRSSYSFVRDQAGNMYWAGLPGCPKKLVPTPVAVCRTSPDGRISLVTGATPFTDIRWMAASPDGTVYLIDDGALRRVTPEGSVSVVAAGLAARSLTTLIFGKRHSLMGLWPDANGDVYVANSAAGQIQKIAPNGTVSIFCKGSGGYSPTGVTVTKSEVVVLEYAKLGDTHVRRFRKDGAEKTR